jgi:hypothetical protein
MTRRVAVVLVHHPVLDRAGEIVTTAITNLDLHDIARSAHTYGLERYYVAHPVAAQRELASRVQEHWTGGSGAKRIPDRKGPMEGLCIVESLEQAVAEFDPNAELWVTSARKLNDTVPHVEARRRLAESGPGVLLVFGTGWGLSPEITDRASVRLEPIMSPRPDGYNHLSVRAAAAIMFDRLLGV